MTYPASASDADSSLARDDALFGVEVALVVGLEIGQCWIEGLMMV